MFSVAESSIRYSVLINMLTVAILIFGLVSMVSLPREEFPAVDFGSVLIVAAYPGASPEEIEQLIVKPIEDGVSDLDGIDYISTTAEESKAIFQIRFESGVDPEKAFDDVTTEVNKITDLPEGAIDPVIIRLSMREVNPIAQIVLGGEFNPGTLREIGENFKDGILDLPNISKVDVLGSRDRQIWIDADQAKLDAYGLTLNDLTAAIQGRNLNIPAGNSRFGKIEFLVRTLGEFQSTQELASLIIQGDANGGVIRLGDVAAVRDTLARAETISRLNGEHSISVLLYKKAEGNIIRVMEEVRNYAAGFEKTVPGLRISVRNDGSIDVRNGINSLGTSALQGIILVFLMMLLFLGWRNAALAAVGIPLSILITFIVLPFFDITLNNLTIFGLIIVVGMVVDNSVVVLENTHRYREMGYCHKDSIILGVDQVIWPVFSSTLTTVASFLPLLLMKGIMGQFLSVFPIVVTVALLGSWYQSMVVLPTNMYQFGKKMESSDTRTSRLINPLVRFYQKAIVRVLKHRALVLWGIIILLLASFGVLASGLIRFEFFPSSTAQTFAVEIKTPLGTKLEETEKTIALVEQQIDKLKEKHDIEFITSTVGSIGSEGRQDIKSSNAQINFDLVEQKQMQFTHDEIKAAIRKVLDRTPGIYSFKFRESMAGPPLGKDVEIRIKGDNLDRLAYIAEIVKANLSKIPGVADIDDSFDQGKKEVRIIPDPDKLALYGLSVAQVAGSVRTAGNGLEVSQYRGGGVDEYPIIVKLDDKYTRELEPLKDLKLKARTGELIALRDLADFQFKSSLAQIEHRDKKRVVTITAATVRFEENGRSRKRSTSEVVSMLVGDRLRGKAGLLPNFEQRYPGYSIEFGGIQEEQNRSYSSLYNAFLIAVLIIYTILASQFRSYVQPLIVMSTIPFAFIGVIFGLLVTGLPFSLNTLISMVALAGVVVNNAILLIDFINQEREKGTDRWHAIVQSGSVRLRPIIMTTGTTIAGMLPIVFSSSTSNQAWRPMAVTFTFGLAFATLLTLFIIPIIYSMVDSFFGRFGLERFKEHKKFTEVMECRDRTEPAPTQDGLPEEPK
jgi:multidrug efflux pump subunit AcrB